MRCFSHETSETPAKRSIDYNTPLSGTAGGISYYFFFFDALEDALYLFISLLDPTFADRIFSNICFIGT